MIDLPGYLLELFTFAWISYVPFGLGNLIMMLPVGPVKFLSGQLDAIRFSSLPIKWFMGFILIVSITTIFLIFHLNVPGSLGPGLLFLTMVLHLVLYNKSDSGYGRNVIAILFVGLILGLTFGGYIRAFSPYPLTPGLDDLNHIYVIKNILNNSIYSPLLYPQTFDMLIALSSDTFQANLLGLFWSGSFIVSALFSISLFVMTYWFTRNQIHALIATIIGLFFTEQGLVSNLQFFFPASFVMSIFPISFFIADTIWNRSNIDKKSSFFLTCILFGGLILLHLEIGTVAALIISAFLIVSHYVAKRDLYSLVARIGVVSLIILVFMYYYGYLTPQIHSATITQFFNIKGWHYDTQEKIIYLKQWYTDTLMQISLFGIIALCLYKERKALALGVIAAAILLVYFQDIDIIHRSMSLERPLIAFGAASLLVLPVNIFKQYIGRYLQIRLKKKGKNPKVSTEASQVIQSRTVEGVSRRSIQVWPDYKVGATLFVNRFRELGIITSTKLETKSSLLYTVAIIILLYPILTTPYDDYFNQYFSKGVQFTNITNEEVEAGAWIEKNTPKDYLIYSDPFTVVEFRGLSYRENLPAICCNKTVQDLVKVAMLSQEPVDTYRQIISQTGEKTLIVITPRTSAWLKDTSIFEQFPVEKLETFRGLDKFFDRNYFKLEYNSTNIYVFAPMLNATNQVTSN